MPAMISKRMLLASPIFSRRCSASLRCSSNTACCSVGLLPSSWIPTDKEADVHSNWVRQECYTRAREMRLYGHTRNIHMSCWRQPGACGNCLKFLSLSVRSVMKSSCSNLSPCCNAIQIIRSNESSALDCMWCAGAIVTGMLGWHMYLCVTAQTSVEYRGNQFRGSLVTTEDG